MNIPNGSYPSLKQAWVIFAIFLAVSIGTALLMIIINNLAGIENLSPGNFVAYNLSMLFVIWFAWRNMKGKVEKVFHFNKIPTILYPLLVVLTLSMAVALDPVTSLIPMPEKIQEIFEMLSKRDIWTFLMVGITGPILEELLFRGVILDGFLKRYNPGKAIFWSAFLFGLFHLNPWQFVPGFIIGLLLGYIYLKTRSLTTVILVHMVNNTFSYLIMYIYGEDVYSFMDLFSKRGDYYFFLVGGTIIFLACIFLLYQILNKNPQLWILDSRINSS
ncbi:MAG TPA: CPBP family intramembrane metalloprotease [Bacteroides sp.]|nr:CPBP family intramembrane metalloprotease [Bacteroides sp.]